MPNDGAPLAELTFTAVLIAWRGPAPYVFAPIPPECVGEVAHAARSASYGWGCVPVTATIGTTQFTTSLMPRDGGYLVPIKRAVQLSEGATVGARVHVRLTIA
ncbi:DUF1905 domain-containing protein [Novosphingobium olei]|uniref:DUF1905 domain-containing protein n=1 Tax=Novosphingobium olei TaxID=2728851 RepID=A0A7Y0GAS4_9SPHN|nr:DUF1905 domain-containing protein [Novosphingobium olei]NML95375.1 DUF1905 domain-containing protein [Novosphingobium olei]